MASEQLLGVLRERIAEIDGRGATKRAERVIVGVERASGNRGPRYRLAGEGPRLFLRMNSNGYLGMALRDAVVEAEEAATRTYGAGPQAVRFISGTYAPHVELEQRLARFHGRPAAMVFSSAYATMMGVLPPLITEDTAVVSDELNHNCIINAMRLAEPKQKLVYRHAEVDALEDALRDIAGDVRRVLVVTDGVFSMRGDTAPLPAIRQLVDAHQGRFAEGISLVVDDSHGVGALGMTGRGTEELTGARSDVLVATLGKALGVNGGYVAGDETLIDYLRETSPFYIYSNPITPAEAAAASAALDLLDRPSGVALLEHVRAMTQRLRAGLAGLGRMVLPGEHPVVALLTPAAELQPLVRHLFACGVLVTGLAYPVVPRGAEEIRFQVSADHTEADIDEVLDAVAAFR